MSMRERRERRAERLREWAEGRDTKAAESYGKAKAIGDAIPFGQPILVGHHSEGRHRRDIDRIHRGMSKSVEHSNKAAEMRSRADNIERALDSSIYSDDADAVEALEARIEDLEAKRARIKAYNASARKGSPDPSILTDAERADIADLERIGSVFIGKGGGFPPYVLANLSGNIKRNRDRLKGIRARQARAERAEEAGGVVIEDITGDFIRVTFAEKPSRDILTALKAAGFQWSAGSWHGYRSNLPEGVSA